MAMTETSSLPEYLAPTGGWPKYALESLQRLEDALAQRRTAEQLLSGPDLETAQAVLSRAIFSLYLDCVEAGAGDDAARILATCAGLDSPTLAPAHSSDEQTILTV
jgi:hypothetical protein